MWICSHLLNKFLTKKFIFCALICASRQNTTVNLKITYFLKSYVAYLFTFFEKVFAICNFFSARCLDERFWGLLYFICLKFNPQYLYLFLGREKIVDLVVIFNEGKEETYAVFLQNRRSSVCMNYLTLVRQRKLILVNFAILYSMHRTSVLLKN